MNNSSYLITIFKFTTSHRTYRNTISLIYTLHDKSIQVHSPKRTVKRRITTLDMKPLKYA